MNAILSPIETAEVGAKDMANAIRALSMDAVQQANSGHPGLPMGMADVATVLFSKFLKFVLLPIAKHRIYNKSHNSHIIALCFSPYYSHPINLQTIFETFI